MQISKNGGGSAVRIVMRKGYDLHVHCREGDMLKLVAPMTVRQFAGAVFMPNLAPPITTAARLAAYNDELRAGIVAGMPKGWNGPFQPLMTLYLTDSLEPREVERALAYDLLGVKYYPPGLTTNSENGVKNPASLWTKGAKPYETLRALAHTDRTLMLHAANGLDRNGEELDPYDQEIDFVKESLPRIRDAHPELRITFEHLSTMQGSAYMREHGGSKLGCTITAQHLLLDRRDTHRKGLHVHKHWWPIIQPKEHRDAIRHLAMSGEPYVFLGTDSAPHPISSKETACCVGGVLTAHCAMELYIEAFENMGKLEKLENFASVCGPKFYGLPLSQENVSFERQGWTIPHDLRFTYDEEKSFSFEESHLKPFRFGEKLQWKQIDA